MLITATALSGKMEHSKPDPEVLSDGRRRVFSLSYKLRILKATDELPAGDVAGFLRQEGLYWSQLSAWRKQRETGELNKARGRKASAASAELANLKRQNARLQKKLQQAHTIIDLQKKLSEILGVELPEWGGPENPDSEFGYSLSNMDLWEENQYTVRNSRTALSVSRSRVASPFVMSPVNSASLRSPSPNGGAPLVCPRREEMQMEIPVKIWTQIRSKIGPPRGSPFIVNRVEPL